MDIGLLNRDNIIGLLRLFSSENELLFYEKNVPHVDITNELISMWFDDEYKPEQENNIRLCFSKKEIIILDEFHLFYNERVSNLPDSKGTVQTWLTNISWLEIMEKAKETLSKLKV